MPQKYSIAIQDPANAVKACVTNSGVSFKKAREASSTLKGRSVNNAVDYLKDVIQKKDCVPYRRYGNRIGNTRLARKYGTKDHACTKGRFPIKACEKFLSLLRNIKNNALVKNMNVDDLFIYNVVVNKAPKIYGRQFRAFGLTTASNKKPAHIQIVCVCKKTNIDVAEEVLEVVE